METSVVSFGSETPTAGYYRLVYDQIEDVTILGVTGRGRSVNKSVDANFIGMLIFESEF